MLIMAATEKAKPVGRRGRKATGLEIFANETAGLPGKGNAVFLWPIPGAPVGNGSQGLGLR